MSKLVWGQAGNRKYEAGVQDVALFKRDATGAYPHGVAWDGVTAVNETPSGGEPTKLYAGNTVYATLMSAEELAVTIEAYQSPEEFDECDGTAEIIPGVTIGQQDRKPFGLAYKTNIGNDTEGMSHGYKLHFIYGAQAKPSEKAHSTINESPEAQTLSWEASTTPVPVTGYKPTASFEIDSTKIDKDKLATIEGIVFGSEETEARLPLPDELIQLLGGAQEPGTEG